MDPRAPLDPQVGILFDALRAMRPVDEVHDAKVMRARSEAFAPALTAGAPEPASTETIAIPGPAGAIRAIVHRPLGEGPHAILVYLHGGGFVQMSPETHAGLTRRLCVGANVIVVSVAYRLAPEDPFPAGLEDCVAAYRWVRENAARLGSGPARVALGGDSAGGNLTAASTLMLLRDGDAPPQRLLLLCPSTKAEFDTESHALFGPDDPLIDNRMLLFFRESYAPRSRWKEPLVSPLHGDLRGFPETLVIVGGIDPLRDSGLAFGEKLRAAGTPVTVSNYEGMPHDFMLFASLNAAGRAMDEICAWLKRG